jgi:site-specific DNA-methyltransferase (adenine-specific)
MPKGSAMNKNAIELKDVFDYLYALEDNAVDLAVVDPPYNQNVDKWDTFNTETEYFDFTYRWLDLTIKKLKSTGSVYLFNNAYNSANILNYLVSKGLLFRNWIVWYKKDGFAPSKSKFVNNQEVILFFTKSDKYTFNADAVRMSYLSTERIKAAAEKGLLKNGKRWFPNPNGKLCSDVWEFSSERHTSKVNGKTQKTFHPTPKPEKMIERIILASSNENDIVLDLFSGSGTTAYIAKSLNRVFIGCENNAEYFDYINKRLIKGEK